MPDAPSDSADMITSSSTSASTRTRDPSLTLTCCSLILSPWMNEHIIVPLTCSFSSICSYQDTSLSPVQYSHSIFVLTSTSFSACDFLGNDEHSSYISIFTDSATIFTTSRCFSKHLFFSFFTYYCELRFDSARCLFLLS